jgi:hypothetical protein
MRVRWPIPLSHTASLVIVILLIALSGCGKAEERASVPVVTPPSNESPRPPENKREPPKSVIELIKELPTLEKEERLGMLRAWTRIPDHAHYRAANASDFGEPRFTHDYGEMAGAYGLAALIVDTTRTENQYNLVIFISRPANKYDVYWIYQNMDLSKYRMSRASGNIYVDYVRDDGTMGVCRIQWGRKERRWACTAP